GAPSTSGSPSTCTGPSGPQPAARAARHSPAIAATVGLDMARQGAPDTGRKPGTLVPIRCSVVATRPGAGAVVAWSGPGVVARARSAVGGRLVWWEAARVWR